MPHASAQTNYTVTIISAYGADYVSPSVSESGSYPSGSISSFSAPVHIYLDRYMNELGPSDDADQAFYRARNTKSPNVSGINTPLIGDLAFTVTVTEDITVIWEWVLEYAGTINFGTETVDGLNDYDAVAAEFTKTMGKKWYGPTASDGKDKFTSIVEASVEDDSGTIRFVPTAYVLENAPNPVDRSINFSAGEDCLKQEGSLKLIWHHFSDFTLEYWARLDSVSSNYSAVIGFNDTIGFDEDSTNLLWAGFSPDGGGTLGVSGASPSIATNSFDGNWHHWAFAYDDANSLLKTYRDGALIYSATNFNIAITNEASPITIGGSYGSQFTLERAFGGGLNHLRFWNTLRNREDLIESMGTVMYGRTPGLVFEVSGNGFDGEFSTNATGSILSSEDTLSDGVVTGSYSFALSDFDLLIPANTGTNEALTALRWSALLPGFYAATIDERDGGTGVGFALHNGDSDFYVDNWTSIYWVWERQCKFVVKVSATDVGDLSDVGQYPYLAGDVNVDGATTTSSSSPGGNTMTVFEEWVPEYAAVTVGTQYRSDDRSMTLSGISYSADALSDIRMNSVVDGSYKGSVTREYAIDSVARPGEIVWQYDATVFRAELAIGEVLDVSSTGALNLQLVPNLCDGGELRIDRDGPSVTASNPSRDEGGLGDAFEWDYTGRRLLPVHPGVFELAWTDAADETKSYAIAFVAGFPGGSEDILWERENEDGSRAGTYGDYVTKVTLAEAEEAFPASPTAHYNAFYSVDSDEVPPVELDANPSDRWAFKRMAFAYKSVVNSQSATFSASDEGRSVLVFSYRPDATESANGNLTEEAIAVRVVEASAFDVQSESVLASGDRQALQTGMDNGLDFTATNTSVFNSQDLDTTIEAWVRLCAETLTNQQDSVFLDLYDTNLNSITIGVVGQSDAEHAGAWFMVLESQEAFPVTNVVADFVPDEQWHHMGFCVDGRAWRIYQDGCLLATGVDPEPYSSPLWEQVTLCKTTSTNMDAVVAEIDNVRIWEPALDATDLRRVMRTATPTVTNSTALVEILFDSGATSQTNGPSATLIPHSGSEDQVVVSSSSLEVDSLLVNVDEDYFPEVATRVLSKLDTAGLGSGYALNRISNYNPNIYERGAAVGEWGPLYPVNWGGLFQAANRKLQLAYYENPYLALPGSSDILHPNVAWPWQVMEYGSVAFPEHGEHEEKRITIASRLGSEGVDSNGTDQVVFDPATYASLSIYNQPDSTETGYNPNEEHGLIAPSIKDQLTGDDSYNLAQNAAFALQVGLNRTNRSYTTYTSEPWVLVQYQVVESGEWEMAAYKVEATRAGSALFPVLDATTHLPTDEFGQPVAQPADPTYDFDYPGFAGDILIPPYPLNLVIGNVMMPQNEGGNIEVDFLLQRALWLDKNANAWMVSGGGRFFYRYWYPLSVDLWFDFDGDGINDESTGTSIAWLPDGASGAADDFLEGSGTNAPEPETIFYSTYWRDDYPILKRGETMTYAGGENQAENTADKGLPAIVGWASGELVYDDRTPAMLIDATNMDDYTARVVRPLDRYTVAFAQATFAEIVNADGAPLTAASDERVMVDGARWYFTELTGSLQKRFYYDTMLDTLVFRGRLNDLESGDADLTSTPISLYCLEPNVMTADDYEALLALGDGNPAWEDAVAALYIDAQNPEGIEVDGAAPTTAEGEEPVFWSGLQSTSEVTIVSFWDIEASTLVVEVTYEEFIFPLNSLGTGAALAPNPTLLSEALDEPLYVTLAENNHADVSGAVALHIVEIGDTRLRGGIKVVEAQNVFDEKINLRHSADFGGNTADVFYQWWVRSVDNLDNVGLPPAEPASSDDDSEWQIYEQALGLNQIEFAGRPDITLADKLFYVRYGEKNELGDVAGQSNTITNDSEVAAATDGSWRLVDINDETDTWERGAGDQVPYQWAGAFNSPQLQADGSKRYIPQLVMGWVKRILDRVNPYEARYSASFDGDAPATYSSMLQEAGKPYIGPVALNSDRDTLQNVGLIELYETVLARAKALTIEIPGSASPDTNQALLLAATRLAVLYNLLASEAYADAQNSSLPVTDEQGLAIPFENHLATANPHVHAFQNQVANLLEEEMALLRGTDFIKAYPSYNRLFWNYLKGLGEAAYNVNYHIVDITEDGIINEYDAATLYPQGHGDAWGHYLSANSMHYALLRHNAFDWEARAELYSLLDNVLEADYLDEQSFAATAAARARVGEEIVRGAYRLAYTADPDGQWQGYADVVDPARAWGLSEWATRAGQGALFDWMVANAIVPEQADPTGTNGVENLDRIDRLANRGEIGGIAAAFANIQAELELANVGNNPLGLDHGAMMFDLNPLDFVGSATFRKTHFEQVYDRAMLACGNALAGLDFASRVNLQLIRTVDDTRELQVQALKQDYDYRDRLIDIFGTPYAGTIGPGEIYAEGYNGPDSLLYMYIDRNTLDELAVNPDSRFVTLGSELSADSTSYSALDSGWTPEVNVGDFDLRDALGNYELTAVEDLYEQFYLDAEFATVVLESSSLDSELINGVEVITVEAPVIRTADYAFQADEDWGRRGAPGKIQIKLNEMLLAENALELEVEQYNAYIKALLILHERVGLEFELMASKSANRDHALERLLLLEGQGAALAIAEDLAETIATASYRTSLLISSHFPAVVGAANDIFAVARASLQNAGYVPEATSRNIARVLRTLSTLNDTAIAAVERLREADLDGYEDYAEILELLNEFGEKLVAETPMRLRITRSIQQMVVLARELESLEAEGLRLMNERAAFNQVLAAKAQRNRYRDMVTRLSRNEALVRYQNAFENAVRYTWLTAQVYDYEAGFSRDDPASGTTFLDSIIRTRQMGLWEEGRPQLGNGGLADILARLAANFNTLKAQLGLNNPQYETGQLSLRQELMRISSSSAVSDLRWKRALLNARVDNVWQVPEFRRFCRPYGDPIPEPGLVFEFSTEINHFRNVFGRLLGGGDHSYSSANFSTKMLSAGVWFQDYDESLMGSRLSTSPRVYLIPVGADIMRVSNSQEQEIRIWDVVTQRIPVPFTINQQQLNAESYIPSVDSLDGLFAEIQRFGDFRAYPTVDGVSSTSDEFTSDSRLIGRSVWNTRWMLIIPGGTLNGDPDAGLEAFIDTVSDIMLEFETYSNTGL